MKMEQTQCSETSAIKHHTPGDNPKDYTQHSEHGDSLISRTTGKPTASEELLRLCGDLSRCTSWPCVYGCLPYLRLTQTQWLLVNINYRTSVQIRTCEWRGLLVYIFQMFLLLWFQSLPWVMRLVAWISQQILKSTLRSVHVVLRWTMWYWEGFSRVLRLSLFSIIPPMFHTNSFVHHQRYVNFATDSVV
jgi:hypothetical protein